MQRNNGEVAKLPWKVVSIASGKGGVGKTLTAVNIALALTRERKKTLILDGDFGLANVDVVLGLEPRYNISDVLDNHVSMADVVLDGPLGLKVIPSGSGVTKLANYSYAQKVGILEELASLRDSAEYLVIDTGAGISPEVLHLNSLSEEVIVVTTPEPHALTDAYAFIKVMSQSYQMTKFNIIINQVRSADEGLKCYQRLSDVSTRFLNTNVSLLGIVPLDPSVHRVVMQRRAASEDTFQTISGQAWKDCAFKIADILEKDQLRNKDEFWQGLVLGQRRAKAHKYAQ